MRGLLPDNVGPITGRAGAEPRSTDRNYTAGPIQCALTVVGALFLNILITTTQTFLHV
ncbi:MAG TPA: hypothetical protein VH475_08060 [Tepidisphaeraceae bacterium]|jgi:hypothetical protein